jgi:hypothetical protein
LHARLGFLADSICPETSVSSKIGRGRPFPSATDCGTSRSGTTHRKAEEAEEMYMPACGRMRGNFPPVTEEPSAAQRLALSNPTREVFPRCDAGVEDCGFVRNLTGDVDGAAAQAAPRVPAARSCRCRIGSSCRPGNRSRRDLRGQPRCGPGSPPSRGRLGRLR